MLEHDFQNQMARLAKTFGPKALSSERIAQIWSTVESLSPSQFERIVEGFIANMKQAPLPKDFQDAVRTISRAGYSRPSGASTEPSPVKITCKHCFDTGLCFISDLSSPVAILMKCQCPEGEWAPGKYTPRWQASLVQIYERLEFDVAMFKPNIKPTDVDSIIEKKIWGRVELWAAKQDFSEQYWKYQIENARPQEME